MKKALRLALPAALAAIAALPAFSSGLDIRWLEKDHDFGLMKEVAGPKTGVSRFVNTGLDPIQILDVRPSCGCTSATFTETPVAPGDTAVISYTYDPAGRPGKFRKTVKVSLADGVKYVINISGNVLGTPESLATLYPVEMGPLRLSDSYVVGGDIKSGAVKTNFLMSYNLSPDTVRPRVESGHPALKVEWDGAKGAGPGDLTTYGIYFDTSKYPDYGMVEIPLRFSVRSADGKEEETTVLYRARVVPDFSRLTPEQERRAPHLFATPDRIDLGVISRRAGNPELEIRVLNEGKSPLLIGSAYADGGDVEIISQPKTLKPGGKGRIKVRLLTGGLPEGPFRKQLTILSNDPRDLGVRTVSIVGEIEN